MDLLSKDHDQEPFFQISSSKNDSRARRTMASNIPDDAKQQQAFDFSSDDVLPGYDFQSSTAATSTTQRNNANNALEQGSASRRNRSSGSPVYLTGELYSARKEGDTESYDFAVVSAVEKTIKKYADNILRVLEGMSGRLSQLESVSHVLEHSVESLKGSVDEYHVEADRRMKSLNDHVTEMHRSLQILRDRQDIMETHAELAKLQASKAVASLEKPKVPVSTVEETVTSQTLLYEQHNLVATSNTGRTASSPQPQVLSLSTNEPVGKMQQLSISADANTLPQQYVVVQHNQPSQQQSAHQLQIPQSVHQSPGQGPGQQFPQIQLHQAPQGSLQQPQQAPQAQVQAVKQITGVMPNPEQLQPQGLPQQLHVHQSPAVGQQLPLPHTHYVSAGPQTAPMQSQQLPSANPTSQQLPRSLPHVQQNYSGNQIPVHTAAMEPYQLTQPSEGTAYSNVPSGVFYGARPPSSGQPAQPMPQHSNAHYHRNQMLYGSPVSGQSTPPNPRAHNPLQTVYNEAPSGGRMSNIHRSSYDRIVDKVVPMGFSVEQVSSVIRSLTDRGQLVDMNTVLDILMNGDNQSRIGWQVR